jgi:hypothetical protein
MTMLGGFSPASATTVVARGRLVGHWANPRPADSPLSLTRHWRRKPIFPLCRRAEPDGKPVAA